MVEILPVASDWRRRVRDAIEDLERRQMRFGGHPRGYHSSRGHHYSLDLAIAGVNNARTQLASYNQRDHNKDHQRTKPSCSCWHCVRYPGVLANLSAPAKPPFLAASLSQLEGRTLSYHTTPTIRPFGSPKHTRKRDGQNRLMIQLFRSLLHD